MPSWLAYFLAGFIIVFVVVNAVVIVTTLGTWVERRVIGRIQSRLGPNRWGPWGLLTPVADALKLLTKESTRPSGVDPWIYNLAPLVFIMPVILVFAVIPFGKNTYVANLNIGILFIIAVTTVPTMGMFMAGWASGNRYSLFGAMRGVAQLISYEVPMVLSIVGVVLLAGSLSMVDIVEAQKVPFIFVQPLGFFIFAVAASAEMNRSPFDIVEADSELVAGFHTEYSGMKWGTFQLAEFIAPFGTSAIIATLFVQGWEGPDPAVPPVVLHQDVLLLVHTPVDKGDSSQAASGPDNGVRMEVPLPLEHSEPVCHSYPGACLVGRYHRADVGDGRNQLGNRHRSAGALFTDGRRQAGDPAAPGAGPAASWQHGK